MKEKLSTLLLVTGFTLVSGQAIAENLSQAIDKTLRSNPDILINKAARRSADHRLIQSKAGYLPTIDVAASIGRDKRTNDTTRADPNGGSRTQTKKESSFTLTQMLFDGFAVKSRVEENSARVEAAASQVVSSIQDVSLRATEAYLEVLRRNALVGLAKENLTNHQKIFQQIQVRSESGLGRKSDLDQAISRMSLARTNLMTEQANLRDAEATYVRVVGVAPMGLQRPKPPKEILPKNLNAAIAIAVENHPTLMVASAEVKASLAQNKSSKAIFYPTVNLTMTGAKNDKVGGADSKSDNLTAEVNMNYNLFRGGADRARERETAWIYEEAKETRKRVRRQVEQSIRISWNAFTSSRAQLRYFKKHADAATRTRDSYSQQFTIGQRSLLDLLDSENELFGARSSYVTSQYSELLGRFRVLNSMGMLVNYLQIKLPQTAIYKSNKSHLWWKR